MLDFFDFILAHVPHMVGTFIVCAAFVGVYIAVRESRLATTAYQVAAPELGLTHTPDFERGGAGTMSGSIRDVPITAHVDREHKGRHPQNVAVIRAQIRPSPGFRLRVCAALESPLELFTSRERQGTICTGDAVFDARFTVHSGNPDRVLELLNHTTRQALLNAPIGPFEVTANAVETRQSTLLVHPDQIAGVVRGLADLVTHLQRANAKARRQKHIDDVLDIQLTRVTSTVEEHR